MNKLDIVIELNELDITLYFTVEGLTIAHLDVNSNALQVIGAVKNLIGLHFIRSFSVVDKNQINNVENAFTKWAPKL